MFENGRTFGGHSTKRSGLQVYQLLGSLLVARKTAEPSILDTTNQKIFNLDACNNPGIFLYYAEKDHFSKGRLFLFFFLPQNRRTVKTI